jgi:hypothetical protein
LLVTTLGCIVIRESRNGICETNSPLIRNIDRVLPKVLIMTLPLFTLEYVRG